MGKKTERCWGEAPARRANREPRRTKSRLSAPTPPQVARSQGKGIFLFRRLKDIMDWRKDTRNSDNQKDDIPVENYVAQRYIENPYLIGGRKFDLRVYVLVMSVSNEVGGPPPAGVKGWLDSGDGGNGLQYIPLRAWLYRDGFARFSNTRFTLNSIDDQ
ncbi:putative tubulin polyglutamylase ttll9, partial [Saguinus oedipus]